MTISRHGALATVYCELLLEVWANCFGESVRWVEELDAEVKASTGKLSVDALVFSDSRYLL